MGASSSNRRKSLSRSVWFSGKALRLRRRELGLTQRDIATMTGRSLRVIGDIERGRTTVEIGVIFDYASIVDIDFILKVRGK